MARRCIVISLKFASGRSSAVPMNTSIILKVVLWILVLGWASWVASQWLRDAFATPAPVTAARTRPALDLDAAVAQAAAAPVFGEAVEPDTAPTAVAAPLDIKLKGVIASGGGPMAAIVNTGRDEDEYVLLGKEVRPGTVLDGVYPTHIVVNRDGVPGRIDLQSLKNDASRSKKAAHSPSAVPSTPATDMASTPAEASAQAEAESSPSLAPPMPQSEAEPDPLSRALRFA
jgi:type II secretory pathway component PulC